MNRFAAYLMICRCCLDLGDLDRAQNLAEAAGRLPVGPCERGKLSWLRASISRKLGNRAEALEHLRRGAETLRTVHVGDTLLISLDLVQAHIEDGDTREARRLCKTMHRLTAPLERNPIISAALTDLLRIALSGRSEELSVRLVRRVRAVVERERDRKGTRARRRWRALAVGPTRLGPARVP